MHALLALLLLAAPAAPAAPRDEDDPFLQEATAEWTQDGRVFAFTQRLPTGSGSDEPSTVVDLWTQKVSHLSSGTSSCQSEDDAVAKRCQAEQKKAHAAFDKQWKRLVPGTTTQVHSAKGLPVQVANGTLTSTPPSRPSHALSVPGAAAETVHLYAAPDGQWAVAAIGTSEDSDPAKLYVVPLVARVDLLDAGAGAGIDETAKKLEQAGYKPSHTARAGSPHARTEVFFQAGFEPEAKEVAKALGLAAEAIQPCTWATAYGITVAAAKP